MLIPKPDIRILTRKVTLENGAEALAYFAVIDVLGVLKVRFLGTKTFDAPDIQKEKVLLLENRPEVVFGDAPVRTIYEFLSPFFNLEFLTSQLARAPSVG